MIPSIPRRPPHTTGEIWLTRDTRRLSSPSATNAAPPSSPPTSTSPSGATPSPTDCSAPPPSTGSVTAPTASLSRARAIALPGPCPSPEIQPLPQEERTRNNHPVRDPRAAPESGSINPNMGGSVRAVRDGVKAESGWRARRQRHDGLVVRVGRKAGTVVDWPERWYFRPISRQRAVGTLPARCQWR